MELALTTSPFLTQREALQTLGFAPVGLIAGKVNPLRYGGDGYEAMATLRPHLPHIELAIGGVSVLRFFRGSLEAYERFRLPEFLCLLDITEETASSFARTEEAKELALRATEVIYAGIAPDANIQGSGFFRIDPTPAWESHVTYAMNAGRHPEDENWEPFTNETISARVTWYSCRRTDNVGVY